VASAVVTFGVAAGLLVVAVLAVWLAARKGYFVPNSTNESSGEERDEIRREAQREEWHIPLRGWWSSWPKWYKFAVVSTVLVAAATLYAFYAVVRTGGGTQALLTWETQIALVAVTFTSVAVTPTSAARTAASSPVRVVASSAVASSIVVETASVASVVSSSAKVA